MLPKNLECKRPGLKLIFSKKAKVRKFQEKIALFFRCFPVLSAVDSRGAGGARAPPEFGGLGKGRSLISAYRSLAITTNTPGFKKVSTALIIDVEN